MATLINIGNNIKVNPKFISYFEGLEIVLANKHRYTVTADVIELVKAYVENRNTGAFHYKGKVSSVSNLPSTGNIDGDMYLVTGEDKYYAWNGTSWDDTPTIVNISTLETAIAAEATRARAAEEELQSVVFGDNSSISPISIANDKILLYNNSSNRGYITNWTYTSSSVANFDLSSVKGATLKLTSRPRNNGYKWAIVTDYTLIPTSYDEDAWASILLSNGGKSYTDEAEPVEFSIPVPNQDCYLVVNSSEDYVPTVTNNDVVNVRELCERLEEGKQNILTFDSTPVYGSTNSITSGAVASAIGRITNVVNKAQEVTAAYHEAIKNTSVVGEAPDYVHNTFGEKGYEIPVSEGELYYVLSTTKNNDYLNAVFLDSTGNIVSIYDMRDPDNTNHGGMVRCVVPAGASKLFWTTTCGGWFIKMERDEEIMLNEGTEELLTVQQLESSSTSVQGAYNNAHYMNGRGMMKCSITSESVLVIERGEHYNVGIMLFVPPCEIGKVSGIGINGHTYPASLLGKQNCLYISRTGDISVTLDVTGDTDVYISYAVYNRITKAAFVIDNDDLWQKSVDNGAYEYILSTLCYSMTIHGGRDRYETIGVNMPKEHVEFATYGGNQNSSTPHIDENSTALDNQQFLANELDNYYALFGDRPYSFGGRYHYCDRKVASQLANNGYTFYRIYNASTDKPATTLMGVVVNGLLTVEPIGLFTYDYIVNMLRNNGCLLHFSHGYSDAQDAPAAMGPWNDAKVLYDRLKKYRDNGSIVCPTESALYAMLNKYAFKVI